MSDLIACDIVRLDDRRRAGPRSLAAELDFLDAYGNPMPGGMLEALIRDCDDDADHEGARGEGAKGEGVRGEGQCEVIYWRFGA